jgi:hypothetical protein
MHIGDRKDRLPLQLRIVAFLEAALLRREPGATDFTVARSLRSRRGDGIRHR